MRKLSDHPTESAKIHPLELGQNAAATLHKGDAVIVVGREHTNSWGEEGTKPYGRDDYYVPVDPMDELQCDSCQ